MADGLFGPTPWEVRQMQQQQIGQQADKYASQDPFQRAAAGMYRAGGGLAAPVAGMFGLENVDQANAARTQEVLRRGSADMTTSKGYYDKAEQFRQAGDMRTAMALFSKGKQLEQQEQAAQMTSRKLDIDERRQASQEMLQNAQAVKALRENPNLAVTEVGVEGKPGYMQKVLFDKTNPNAPHQNIGEPYLSSAAAKQQFHITTGGGEGKQLYPYKDRQTGEIKWGSNIEAKGQIPLAYDPSSKSMLAGAGEAGKAGQEMNANEFSTATAANAALPAMTKLRTMIESGKYNSGMAAEMKQGMSRALATLGGRESAKTASNTQIIQALTGAGVFPLIQSLGIGARGLDTPAERQFLLDVMVGNISMEPSALLDITKDRQARLQQTVDNFNARVIRGELDDWFKFSGRTKAPVGSRKTVKFGDL